MDLFDLDPDRPRRTNKTDEGWWDQLTADSPLWSSEGSLAREHFPILGDAAGTTDHSTGSSTDSSTDSGLTGGEDTSDAPAAGRDSREKGRSSWVLVGSLRESAQALALAPLPDDAGICRAEAEELLFAQDRITCALADRVRRVHGAGQAKQHGHASTRSWLRAAAGMSVAGAGRLLTLAVELARLPRVREKFAEGGLAAGVVEAICMATAQLSDEHAALAEPILLELAGKGGAAEVAKAGRYLRAVLDPDGEDRDEQADYARRFLRVRPTRGGGLEGEFHLPREAAARLRALLDAYAKPRAEGDDRPLRVRNADAFIALLEQKIATELLVLVNAESLPTDPQPDPADPDLQPAAPGNDHPEDAEKPENAEGAEGAEGVEGAEDGLDSEDTSAPGDTASADDPGDVEESNVEDTNPGDADNTSTPGEMGDPSEMGDPGDVSSTDTAPAQDEGLSHPADYGEAGADAGSPSQTARPDPPPEHAAAHHAHAGHRPARDCRHAQDTREDHTDVRGGRSPAGTAQEASPGALPGTAPGALPGAVLGTVPGLLLATGQVLPVSSVHRLARTSTLVRLVMDAEGQVLDMGRKVRLATPAQRRAIYTRYATCWIDGCPLPATMCQIDHADNWSTGGLTNLKLLGPACQFHNRDRYQHPDRYTRHKTGTDRWTFTYQPTHTSRLRI
ncbi:DUF222 domain-containing protein [Microbispora sp. KK1-11]|uniref:DUF222 domain-containing protein n=1 Tax=Microbispora sp. KK1-11 TaxID=2053005 RepID=UPI0011596C5E|nr:DUF222 domain-containing protein [Microbispora sp. KK1-11]TQS25024.1 DUF222 domain-containing protein [Microbispora sp. KK1-11]